MVEDALKFLPDTVPTEPVYFQMGEGDAAESFQAAAWLPGPKFLRYSRMMHEGGLQSTILVDDFFRDVMDSAEYERFMKYCDDLSHGVTTSRLADIFLTLFARYSAGPNEATRPTQPPAPSSSGPGGTADTSTENSSSGESTPAG